MLKISKRLIEVREGERIPGGRGGIQVWWNALASQQLPTLFLRTLVPSIDINHLSELKIYIFQALIKAQCYVELVQWKC